MGETITDSFKDAMNSSSIINQNKTQTVEAINVEIHINNEDGESSSSIAEKVYDAFREGISNLSIF
jgi:hypothetical protein